MTINQIEDKVYSMCMYMTEPSLLYTLQWKLPLTVKHTKYKTI
jgi:hypothetical protein